MEDWSRDILESLKNTNVDSNQSSYDNAFFKDHLKYRPIYNFLGDLIVAEFNPKSVIDWGCGGGILAKIISNKVVPERPAPAI